MCNFHLTCIYIHLFPLYTLKHQTPSYNVPLNTAHPVTICLFTHTKTQSQNITPIHTNYKAKASLPCIMWTLTVRLTIHIAPIQRMCPLTNYNSHSHAARQTCPFTNCTAYYHSQSVINTHEQKTPNHKAPIYQTSNHNMPIHTTQPITMQPFTQHPITIHPFMQHTESQCSHSYNNAPIHTTHPITTHSVTTNLFTQWTNSHNTQSQCSNSHNMPSHNEPIHNTSNHNTPIHITHPFTMHAHTTHPFTGEVCHTPQAENPCTLTLWTDYD